MEISSVLGGVSVLLAFAFGWLLFLIVAKRGKKAPLRLDSLEEKKGAGYVVWRVRNGYRSTRVFARALLRFQRVEELTRQAVLSVQSFGLHTTREALLSVGLVLALGIFVAASVFASSFLVGFAVALCCVALSVVWLRSEQEKRQNELREAVPEALRSMGVCFQSGYSLLQTFSHISSETKGPLKLLFSQATHRLETGGSVQDSLDVLRCGEDVSELSFVAVALDVQHQSGGSMRHVLDAARSTVESELELRRSLRVQTAQAALSARVVSVMPFVLIALFSLMSEDFLLPFFSSPLGFALLGIALAMQGLGIFIVRRMLSVEVE